MIWLALVALVFVAGGAWFVSKSMLTRLVVLGLGIVAVGAYWFVGHPHFGDQPLSARVEVLEATERTHPESITPPQKLAMLLEQARKSPNDPAPLMEIGGLYLANGRMPEAATAYRNALQRDPNYGPALDAMSELSFISTGEVDAVTLQRLPEIRNIARTKPESLTTVQVLALINERLASAPEDSAALRMAGDIYASVQHYAKAEAAYSAAVEHAPKDKLALKGWADSRFKESMAKETPSVDPETTDLYLRAYKLDTSDLRLGYLAGIGLWLQGKKAEAQTMWDDILKRAPEGGPHRQMFAALRETFGIDKTSAPAPAPAVTPPTKP